MANMRVGIIGGGIAGLVAAYELSNFGAQVTLFEQASQLGGLAGSFPMEDGQRIEKYYHFICKPDKPYLDMIEELGLSSRLRWVTTEMGLFHNGLLYTLSDPFSLLAFPRLSIVDKARFAWSTALSKFRSSSSWRDIESVPAKEWLVQRYGDRAYRMLYQPLLDLKFHEHASKVSAAWMWARLHRLGNSCTVTQKERIGYLEGGSQVYVKELENAVRSRGAEVCTSAHVERVVLSSNRAIGVQWGRTFQPFDCVLSTVPVPCTYEFFAEIGGPYFDNLRHLEYTGVMVMLLRINRRFSKYFWMNTSDARLNLAGIIEYTNLNPCEHLGGDSILYIPQYLPHTHPLCAMSDAELFGIYAGYLRIINPQFRPDWVRQYWVHRDQFAQPICETGFSKCIPSIETPVDGLFLTDSCQVHPYDRSISASTKLGQRAALRILSKQAVCHKDSARSRGDGSGARALRREGKLCPH